MGGGGLGPAWRFWSAQEESRCEHGFQVHLCLRGIRERQRSGSTAAHAKSFRCEMFGRTTVAAITRGGADYRGSRRTDQEFGSALQATKEA